MILYYAVAVEKELLHLLRPRIFVSKNERPLTSQQYLFWLCVKQWPLQEFQTEKLFPHGLLLHQIIVFQVL